METKNLLLFIVYFATIFCRIRGVTYDASNNAPNTPGGKVFDQEIGIPFVRQSMEEAAKFIWGVFEQQNPANRKPVQSVHTYISDFDNGYAYANLVQNAINISAPGIYKWYYPRNMSKFYMKSLLYHEMTHIYQWFGNGKSPSGLSEGIADYMFVKAKLYEPAKYPKFGDGKKWDEGYGVTERFLEYCASIRPNFVSKLNKKLRYDYNENFFKELLGKPVDQLWREYKAKYHKTVIDSEDDEGEILNGYFPLIHGNEKII